MTSPETSFAAEFQNRKEIVDASVDNFADELRVELQSHDALTQAAIESYLDLLYRGGKRIRGVLTLTGYGLVDSDDPDMIAQAAAYMEAIHAYLLVFDDVADNSDTRRGGDTAHVAMRKVLSRAGISDSAAAKVSIDMVHLGALYAQHVAQARLHDLPVAADRKSLAAQILNHRLAATGIGQLRDISPLDLGAMTSADALETAKLKTALYTFVLPTQVGAALGGASTQELTTLEKFGLHAGLAFQLRDDILGLVGDPDVTGKPTNDIVEGKRTFTLLTAIERANKQGRDLLRRMLGFTALTYSDYAECLDVMRQTEAIETTRQLAEDHTQAAVQALDTLPNNWRETEITFMRNVALAGLQRKN